MPRFVAKRLALAITVMSIVGFSHGTHAAGTLEGKALIEAQLEEAKKLLEEDTASFEETAEKKLMIDEKLAARKAREDEIHTELKQLCEEQNKLSPGTLNSCMAKLNN